MFTTMRKIPIVFAFNDGYALPAGVCISSLLSKAKQDVFYDIFILHSSDRLSEKGKSEILRLKSVFANCDFTFIDVQSRFAGAFEIRNITIDAYYRLLIPFVIDRSYERVLYSDVDVIFQGDISELINLAEDKPIAGVNVLSKEISHYVRKDLGLEPDEYINSGVMVWNRKYIPDYQEDLNRLIQRNFIYQDQDIVNILFDGQKKLLPEIYNYSIAQMELDKEIAQMPKIIHYTGPKPWKEIVPFAELWWEEYRKSIYYDEQFYLNASRNSYRNINTYRRLGDLLVKYKFLDVYKKIRSIL